MNMENPADVLRRGYGPAVSHSASCSRGDQYKFWGLWRSKLHLFGVDSPGKVFLFGTDRMGRDMSRAVSTEVGSPSP